MLVKLVRTHGACQHTNASICLWTDTLKSLGEQLIGWHLTTLFMVRVFLCSRFVSQHILKLIFESKRTSIFCQNPNPGPSSNNKFSEYISLHRFHWLFARFQAWYPIFWAIYLSHYSLISWNLTECVCLQVCGVCAGCEGAEAKVPRFTSTAMETVAGTEEDGHVGGRPLPQGGMLASHCGFYDDPGKMICQILRHLDDNGYF